MLLRGGGLNLMTIRSFSHFDLFSGSSFQKNRVVNGAKVIAGLLVESLSVKIFIVDEKADRFSSP